jgi:ABC-type sugar transport system ATPase subunit
VTHAIEFLHLVDRIVVVKNGEICTNGAYADVKDTEIVKELIGIHRKNQSSQSKPNGESTLSNAELNFNKSTLLVPPGELVNESTDNGLNKTLLTSMSQSQDPGMAESQIEEIKTQLIEIEEEPLSEGEHQNSETSENADNSKSDLTKREMKKKLRLFSGKENKREVDQVMIEDEGDEDVIVEGKSYHRLMIMGGGWLPFIGVNFSMLCFIFCSIAGDYITQ